MLYPQFDPHAPPRVLVVGDLMVDRYLWGTCDRVSPEAPVQVINVQRESRALGGAGNVVANLRAFGADGRLVAVVGDDAEQTEVYALLVGHGAPQEGLVVDKTRPTTIKARVVAGHQQIVRFDKELAAAIASDVAERVLAAVETELEGGCSVVVLSDYGKGVLTPELTQSVIDRCRARGVPVLVDPKGADYTKYRGASLLTPNRKEASAATGISLAGAAGVTEAGLKLVRELALDACLITLSEHGMAVFEGEKEARLPTDAREVFDVTGAGDTAIAAVAFGIACGLPLLDACRFANRAAGIVVGKVGVATVTLDEMRGADRAAQLNLDAKIVTRAALVHAVASHRASARRVIFTNGCFDILHAGHVRYLAQAKALGDVLVVGLNSDASVGRLKGPERPINNEHDRAVVLASLSAVDYVVAFEEDTPLALIEAVLPDILVKGGDYTADAVVGGDVVRRAGGSVEILPFLDGRSTSKVISRIQGARL